MLGKVQGTNEIVWAKQLLSSPIIAAAALTVTTAMAVQAAFSHFTIS